MMWVNAVAGFMIAAVVILLVMIGFLVPRRELDAVADPVPRLQAEIDRTPDEVVTYEAIARWLPQPIVQAIEVALAPHEDHVFYDDATDTITLIPRSPSCQ